MTPLTTWETVSVLLTRGLTAAEVAQGLDLPEHRIREVARDVRDDGDRTLYLDGCFARTKDDPHKLDGSTYLYVRGVPWGEALRHTGVGRGKHPPAPVEAREAYRRRQLERATAGVLS